MSKRTQPRAARMAGFTEPHSRMTSTLFAGGRNEAEEIAARLLQEKEDKIHHVPKPVTIRKFSWETEQ